MKAHKSWVFLRKFGMKRRGQEEGFTGPHIYPFLCCLLLSASLSEKKASHSSLWSWSASRGHGRTVLSILLLSFPAHQAHLEPDLSPSFGTTPWPSSTARDLGFAHHLEPRTRFCVHLFPCVGLNPDHFVSHKSSHRHWDFADWISKLGDNYFSISVIPAARIYSQFTVCNITHSHSSSSACSSSLLLSFPFLAAWGLSLHES